jgi:Protein of unknown function (DUF1648)
MQRLAPVLVFFVLLAAACVYLPLSTAALPERVAAHFGADGTPNGFMSRADYRGFILLFTLGLPLLVVAALGLLPRAFGTLKLPNADYWMGPQRRAETLGFLTRQAFWLGSLLVLFLCGVHALVVQANAPAAPHLGNPLFFALLAAFLLGMAAWALAFMLRFRRPR